MIDDLLDDRGLDAFARLVEQHQARPADQAPGERQDLLLAARERPAGAVKQGREDREGRDDLLDAAITLAEPGADMEILAYRQVRKDPAPLGDVAKTKPCPAGHAEARDVGLIKADGAVRRRQLANQRAQQGRLAHAVVAEHADDLACPDLQGDPVQDRDRAVAGAQLLDLKHISPSPSRSGAHAGYAGCSPSCPRPGSGPGGTP